MLEQHVGQYNDNISTSQQPRDKLPKIYRLSGNTAKYLPTHSVLALQGHIGDQSYQSIPQLAHVCWMLSTLCKVQDYHSKYNIEKDAVELLVTR